MPGTNLVARNTDRNYICFTEVGLDRKYAESQREDYGWNSKLNFAVVLVYVCVYVFPLQ